MTCRELIYDIERYCPFNEQEEKDKALILNWIKTNDNAFSRDKRKQVRKKIFHAAVQMHGLG